MATNTISTQTNLVDSAIGPFAVTMTVLQGYDIDDLVHGQTRAMALQLAIKNKAYTTNPILAANRPPINIEDAQVGGY